jgi:hypothetical protein
MSTQGLPRHTLRGARLAAKRDILHATAQDYARGASTADDLEVAAVEFAEAMADKAMEGLRGRR